MLCLAQFSKPSFRQLSPHSLVYTAFIRLLNVNIPNAEISKRSLPRDDSEADEDRFTLNAISESLSYCEPPGDPEGEMVTGLDCTVPGGKKSSVSCTSWVGISQEQVLNLSSIWEHESNFYFSFRTVLHK